MDSKIAIPEPMPVPQPNSALVLDLVKQDLDYTFQYSVEDHDTILSALEERSDYGLAKYGTRLEVPNGRDFQNDTLQEVADSIVYWRGYLADRNLSPNNFIYRDLLQLFLRIARYETSGEALADYINQQVASDRGNRDLDYNGCKVQAVVATDRPGRFVIFGVNKSRYHYGYPREWQVDKAVLQDLVLSLKQQEQNQGGQASDE